MKQRILVAVIGVPALIGVLCFAPDWATAVLVAALCVIGCHEFMGAAAPEKAAHWWGLAATLSVFTVFTVYFSGGAFAGRTVQKIMTLLLAAPWRCRDWCYRWRWGVWCGCGCWNTARGWC